MNLASSEKPRPQPVTTRRKIMLTSRVCIVLVLVVVLLGLQTVGARAQKTSHTMHPQIVDTRHASDEASTFFASFFTAKSRHDVAETMEHFSPHLVTYTASARGWPLDGFDAVKGTFPQYMPKWPETGLSYPTRILGGAGSAVVAFTDTTELSGGELRILDAVDFEDGKIVRWVDYWDSRSFDDDLDRKCEPPKRSFQRTSRRVPSP
jgi:ketosteroid isomerase-like protein